MIISRVKIDNFRNINNIEFFPHKNMNILFGKNAQGKTNILEAIWFFTGNKSFRGAKDSETVLFGKNFSEIELDFADFEQDQTCKIKIEKTRKFFLNKSEKELSSKKRKIISAVIFSPQDLSLLSEGPSIRRKFLDDAICQIYPAYSEKIKLYNRAVFQRNNALKQGKFFSNIDDILSVFEETIAKEGLSIIKYRKRYVERLKEEIPKIFFELSEQKETIKTEYVYSVKEDFFEFCKELKRSRQNDIQQGITSLGPHRDDLEILINGVSARNFGSQGQKRSAALSLKLSEAAVVKKTTNRQPIALLDDVMSELDPSRQKYILNHIKDWQVFITCCDPSNFENLINGAVFEINNGSITKER